MCDRLENISPPRGVRRHGIASRTGSVYLLALGASTLIAVIGLLALTKVRINQRLAKQGEARSVAQALAQSAVEQALTMIDATPQWRTVLRHDVDVAEFKLGDGTFTWRLIDEDDGDLSNDEGQLVRLRGTGRSGQAVQMYALQLRPVKTPLTCLEACLHGGGLVSFSGATVRADAPVSTNGSMNAFNATVNATVQAAGGITGATYSGKKEPGSGTRELPDAVTVFDHYLENGTVIQLGALPLDGAGFRVLERLSLGKARNPLGLANPEGIYVIRCGGAPIIVRNCRIVGTLVLLDPGVNSRVEGSVNWEPGVTTYPALMVRGSMDIRTTNSNLSESSGGSNVNYNPPGVPYNGTEDLDTSDSYPSVIKGIVYVTEKLINNTNGINVEGMIVVGQTTNVSSEMTIKYRKDVYQDPPPGFYYMNKMVVVPNSWRQDVK
jgi:hypothetical protein